MSRKRLVLPAELKDRLTTLLGGQRPTTTRLIELLEDRATTAPEATMPLDQDDIEKGREVYGPRAHAEAAGTDVEAAVTSVAQGRARRVADGRERVQERIEEHRSRGLDPGAPPEDPVAAATLDAEDAPPMIDLAPPIPLPPFTPEPSIEADRITALKATGMARTREVAEQLERQLLQRMPALRGAGSRLRSLEEAAEVLLAELQPAEQDAMRQVCVEHALDPWVVILGAVARMAQLQELHAGEFDPEWRNRTASVGGHPISAREQKCETCGGLLPADARRGQKFCCSHHGSEKTAHSDGCALAYLELRQGRWVDTRPA